MFAARNPTGFATADRFRLASALAVSLAFHGLILGADRLIGPSARPAAAAPQPLQATLVPPARAPVLLAPEAPRQAAVAPSQRQPPRPPRPAPRGFVATDAATAALRQIGQRLLYPPEAVAQGLEGEALVMLFLDEAGNAIAARLEKSSGHAILDDAAVRAAEGVRALPEGAPSEVLLPVRFRLR